MCFPYISSYIIQVQTRPETLVSVFGQLLIVSAKYFLEERLKIRLCLNQLLDFLIS